MPSLHVRVTETAHKTLRQLANGSGESMQSVLDKAVEDYSRKMILLQANAAFQALRDNPEEWQDELDERKLWEATLMDGIDES